jgi:tRNA(Ile)-lysidine synthase
MHSSLLYREVEGFFKNFLPTIPQKKNICVAVSGGSDSTALFYLLLHLKETLGISRLGIAHVNHKLRGKESDDDAAFVRDISINAHVAFHEKTLSAPPARIGIEEWARSERYGFFTTLFRKEGYNFLATGHTAGDQAETVLMRIMRGCGLKGLCAISPVRNDGIIRPVLALRRSELRGWLFENGIAFREDSSNQDIAIKRNFIRHILLPSLSAQKPETENQLERIAQKAFATWQLLLESINKWIAANVVPIEEGKSRTSGFKIRKAGIRDFAFAEEAVAETLRKHTIQFTRPHVEKLLMNAKRANGVFLLPGGWFYQCEKDTITVRGPNVAPGEINSRQNEAQFHCEIAIGAEMRCDAAMTLITVEKLFRKSGETAFSVDNMTVFLDADATPGPFEFRPLRPDDMFRPLGSRQVRHVKAFLKKRKNYDPTWGAVTGKSGDIVWIPGVQISHGCRVTPETKVILKFSCKRI